MNLSQYLRMILTQDEAVAALVGDRVYSEVLPQASTLPAIVFDLVSSEEDYTLQGPSGARRTSVTVECWSETRAEATALGEAVKRVLSGHSGAAAGLEVQTSILVSERWEFDPDTMLCRLSLDLEAWLSSS